MYDIEVCVLDKVTTIGLRKRKPQTLEEGREAETLYSKKLIRINLTNLSDLAFGDYDTFIDELIGIILHENLHYFFYFNEIPQNEELIENLSTNLQVLSLGHLIGATNSKDEDIEAYDEWLNTHFVKHTRSEKR